MNKLRVFVILFFLVSVLAFCQNAEKKYEVTQILGNVYVQTQDNTWQKVNEGMILLPSAVIKTGLNAKLTITVEEHSFSVTQLRQGSLAELVDMPTSISIGETPQESSITSDETKPVKGVSTISTRANPPDTNDTWYEE